MRADEGKASAIDLLLVLTDPAQLCDPSFLLFGWTTKQVGVADRRRHRDTLREAGVSVDPGTGGGKDRRHLVGTDRCEDRHLASDLRRQRFHLPAGTMRGVDRR